MLDKGAQSRLEATGSRRMARVAVFATLAVAAIASAAPGAAAQNGLTCLGLPATIVGTNLGETILGTPGDDVIVGLGGRDTILGLGGNDTICAGTGNDTVRSGPGEDRVDGEDGNDRIYGESDADEIDGGPGNDRIYGDDGDDELRGGSGNDRVEGGDGDDVIDGEAGNDSLLGGDDDDEIDGGPGTDRIYGNDDDDTITDTDGNSIVVAGNGSDVIVTTGGKLNRITAGNGDNVITGGDGREIVTAGSGNDQIDTGGGGDIVSAGAGDDQIETGLGNDRSRGGLGDDTITDSGGTNLLFGDQGDDTIKGGPQQDRAYGGSGDDTIDGAGGSDRLYGQTGNDRLTGGSGTNFVDGGPQFDICDLGDGGTLRFCEADPNDGEAPEITAPLDVIAEATGQETAVDIGIATATDNDDPDPVVSNDAPERFPLGDTTVTWTATDASGNQATATQTITVQDTTPPTIVAPAEIKLGADNLVGIPADDPAIADFLADASSTDLVDSDPTVTNDGPEIYPVGETLVTFTATDDAGNLATATSAVSVEGPVVGVIVEPTSGLQTTEGGGTASFTVVLQAGPSGTVVIPVSVSDPTEATVDTVELTFSTTNWATPQTVTITGIDDEEPDDDQPYVVELEEAFGGGYDGIDPPDVSVTNLAAQTAAISGTIWADQTPNSLQDPSEPGIGGVEVNLHQPDDDGEFGPVVDTALSQADGSYIFVGLPVGDDFVVRLVLPANFHPVVGNVGDDETIDSDFDDVSGAEVTTVAGENADVDAGLLRGTAYTGLVWLDVDADGVQSLGDQGIPNVTIEQYSAGVLIGTVTTGPNGKYELIQPVGGGQLRIAIPNGLGPVTPGLGNDPELDSDFSFAELDGIIEASASGVPFAEGNLDAGFSDVATITGFVWSDENQNGLLDQGDKGLERVEVNLLDSEGRQVASALTDSGAYSFSVAPGTYSVQVVGPAGLTPTAADVGDDDSVDSDIDSSGQAEVPVTYTVPGFTVDAGFILLPGSITVDPTSGLNTGEDGTSTTFTVVLDSQPTETVTIAVTSSNEAEGLTDVDQLVFTTDDWDTAQTVTVTGVDDELDDGDIEYTIELGPASGGSYQGIDPTDVSVINADDDEFAAVSGFVWLDGSNGGDVNSLQDNGESGIGGVVVNLHGPDVPNPPLRTGEGPILQTTTTGDDGNYSFSIPVDADGETFVVRFVDPAGHLRVDPDVGDDDTIDSDFPFEPESSFDADAGVTIVLEPGDVVDIDAGYRSGPPVSGRVWNDLDGNGLQDDGEPGLGGVAVEWKPDGEFRATERVLTEQDGTYQILLSPANGYLTVNAPTDLAAVFNDSGTDDTIDSDYRPLADGDADLRIFGTQNSAALELDAGFTEPTVTIGDFIWNDLNENGLQDPGEPGVEGITVNILDTSTGTAEATTTTDSDGFYNLSVPVGNGSRNFQVIPPEDAIFTEFAVGDDDTIDSNIIPSIGRYFLSAGAGYREGFDAGLIFSQANIRGIVWDDSNQDGIRDNDEPAVGSVAVRLLNADTLAVVAETTTESASIATGTYEFNAEPGDYLIEVVPTTGFGFSPANQGDDDTVDSDIEDGATGRTAAIIIDAVSTFEHIDAGLIALPGTVSGFVWADVTKNDIQDSDEIGIPDVEVRLHGPNVPRTIGSAAGAILQTTTTDSDGIYSFSVPVSSDGQRFVVRFVDPLGHARVAVNAGSDDTVDSDLPPEPSASHLAPAGIFADLDPGETVDSDVGYEPGTLVTGLVWHDLNVNALQDDGEPGISDVTIERYEDDDLVETIITSQDGTYQIRLKPDVGGSLRVLNPPDLAPVNRGVGDDPTIDSDFSAQDGYSARAFGSFQQNLTEVYDAGFADPIVTIGDLVWNDLNANGIQDQGEPGLAGIPVKLIDFATETVLAETTTDADGLYSLTIGTRGSGSTILVVEAPAGATFSARDAGDDDSIDSDVFENGRRSVAVRSPGTVTNIDAGIVLPADSDGDGIVDTEDNCPEDANADQADNDGDDLGDVCDPDDDNDGLTDDRESLFDTDPFNPDSDDDGLTDGEEVNTYGTEPLEPDTDYGGIDDGQEIIDGTDPLFSADDLIDTDGDGVIDGSDNCPDDFNPDQADANDNGIGDLCEEPPLGVTVSPTSGLITDEAGQSDTFTVVLDVEPTGTVTVPISSSDTTEGTTDTALLTFTLANWDTPQTVTVTGVDDTDVDGDIGYTINVGPAIGGDYGDIDPDDVSVTNLDRSPLVFGRVWDDLNRNARQDPGEPGIAGVTIERIFDSAIVETITTDLDGTYEIRLASGGENLLRAFPPADMTGVVFTSASSPTNSDYRPGTNSSTLRLSGDGEYPDPFDAGFAIAEATYGDFVWNDLDENGQQDPGEPGVQGVVVNLYDYSNNQILLSTTTTDGDGLYSLTAPVPGGPYIVEVVPPLGASFTIEDIGSQELDSDVDPDTGRVLISGVYPFLTTHTADAGLVFATGTDTDGDGVLDNADNCPDDANPGQEDNDGDDAGDVCDPDDDNDGLLDTEESAYDTGRFNPDSDDDGLLDGEEVHTYGTEPLEPDTDYGGVDDGQEIIDGTDPLDDSDDLTG
ncbi:MAG: SdrD B-like domain-containing protein [Acidimicrobiales bacterium]